MIGTRGNIKIKDSIISSIKRFILIVAMTLVWVDQKTEKGGVTRKEDLEKEHI